MNIKHSEKNKFVKGREGRKKWEGRRREKGEVGGGGRKGGGGERGKGRSLSTPLLPLLDPLHQQTHLSYAQSLFPVVESMLVSRSQVNRESVASSNVL